MLKKVIASCLAFCFVFAGTAFADWVDLAVNTSGTVTAATGQLTTFERFNSPSTGTGVFTPFVRIQNNGTEKGYNTDGPVKFDTKAGIWTRSIKLSDVMTDNGLLEFLLDINQSQGGNGRFLSLDTMKIYLADSGSLDNYNPSSGSGLGELIYDMGDNWVKMDNTVFNPGSGTGDMRVLIPKATDWSSDKYLYLYTEFGKHFSSNAGFEEWSSGPGADFDRDHGNHRPPPIPEPASALLLIVGAGVLRLRRGQP